tara:strand:- start:14 stop:610 length:597 start_codon:yes stop_codon:yes gene_type:complete
MLKALIKIIITYKLNLIFIIYYEIKYIFFLKYKCNEIDIIKSKNYTDNIPTPYFFLDRIFNFIKNKKIKKFTDIGCGSGRVINFFSRKKSNLKIIGYEINKNIFLRTKIFFKNNNKIQIKNINVLKSKKLKSTDIFYLADPFKKNSDYNKIVKLISKSKKKMYIIVVNISNNLKVFKKYKIINQFQCNKLGYKIYTNK